MLDRNKQWLDNSNKSNSDKERFSVFSKYLKTLISEKSTK